MLKRKTGKGLCFFLLAAVFGPLSCEKKAVWTGESPKLAASDVSEKTAATEENIRQPEVNPETDTSQDAVKKGIDFDNVGEVLLIGWWNTKFQRSHISFKTGGDYLLTTAPEGDWFGEGVYRVEGNTIIVEYPFKTLLTDGLSVDTMEWLFKGENPTVLTYDKSYRDFDVLTCLRFGDKILRNRRIESPVGEEYELDGFQVVKYEDRENNVLILENLRMRKLPEATADAVTLKRIVGWEELKSVTSDIVYAGDVYGFDAKTVKTDAIDSITAPWYRLVVVLNDFESAGVWVFGGYLKEISQNEWNIMREDYYKTSVQRLMDNGVIVK
jgi:hypothetical protein